MENNTLLISAKDIIGCEFNTELSCANLSDYNLQCLNRYAERSSHSFGTLEIETAIGLYSPVINTVIPAISQKVMLYSDYRNELLLEIKRKINEAKIMNSEENKFDIQLTEQLLCLLEQAFESINNDTDAENAGNYITIVVYTIHTNLPLVTSVSFSLK